MKHFTRFVLALAALATHTARADVTVYGALDASFDSVSTRGATSPAQNVGRTSRVSSNSSNIGFKGNEDLGDGLKAVWQIENSVALDTGNSAPLGSRDTFVGLNGRAGMLQLGHLTSSARMLEGVFDINKGVTGPGLSATLLGKLGNLAITDPTVKTLSAKTIGPFDNRVNNAVQYTTPMWNQFQLSALYGAGESPNGPGAYTANIGGTYYNGPLYAGLSYTRITTGADSAAPPSESLLRDIRNVRAMAAYLFSSNTRVGAFYDVTEGNLTDAGDARYGGKRLRQAVWYVNGSLGVTATGRLIAQYGQAGSLTGGSEATAQTGKAKHYEFGYEHDLSKRTTLKAVYAEIRNQPHASYDFAINPIAATPDSAATGATLRCLSIGMRHTF